MNRRYSHRLSRYQNGLSFGIAGMAAGVVAIILLVLLVLRLFLPGVLSMISRPFWNVGGSLTSALHGTATTESKASLIKTRDTLTGENTALTVENAALKAKVTDLTALLGTRTETTKGVVASVVARPPVAPYDVLIIDQGSNDGVHLGAAVQGAGGTPVGTVGETDTHQSRVTLYSTRGIQTNGWVGETRIPVTLTGAGAGAFVTTVPKDTGIHVGDGVYLASAGAFPIVTVVTIETDPSSPSVVLDVHPYSNPFSLTWVTVAR
jgi:cell shape-determining protein MreC